MNTINIIFCGLGGQGILFMTKVLAQTAMSQGFTVLGAETHGMAQRGGSVISHLRLGDVESSLVSRGKAHFLLALEENESYRSLPFLSKGGGLFVNSNNSGFPREEVKAYLETKEIQYHHMAASEVAMSHSLWPPSVASSLAVSPGSVAFGLAGVTSSCVNGRRPGIRCRIT